MTSNEKFALLYVNSIRFIRLTIIKTFSNLLFSNNEKFKRILINRDGAFGDSIVAIPALSIIRQSFPDAKIDLLCINESNVSFKDFNLNSSLINQIYVVKKEQRKATLKRLRNTSYDLFIQLPQNIGIYKSIRNMLLVRFYLNIKNAFGWDCGRIKSFMRLQKTYADIPTETVRFIRMLEHHNISGNANYPILGLKPACKNTEQLLALQTTVAFLIGGKIQPKKWPLDYWVALAEMLGDQHNILVLGGKDELEEANYISSKCSNANNLCGKLTIPELFYVLTKTPVAISLDTGAMHLCDAAGTITIALFSTRDLSNKWWPNNDKSIILEKVLPCSFCLKTTCADNICMKNIEPKEVYDSFLSVYAGDSSQQN